VIISIDTETSSLPRKGIPLDHPEQPHLVELGAVLCEDNGKERASFNLIVRPDGWEIPEEASNIHGITTQDALACGVPLLVALSALTHLWGQASLMIAHNAEFDLKIIDIALARAGREPTYKRPPSRCTMRLATPVLNLPPTPKMITAGMTKPKRPSLQEAHTHLVGHPFEGAHNALADARACARVFFAMKEKGLV